MTLRIWPRTRDNQLVEVRSNNIMVEQQLEELKRAYRAHWEQFPTKKSADGRETKDIPSSELARLRAMATEIESLSVKALSGSNVVEVKNRPISVAKGHAGSVADQLMETAQWQGRIGAKFGDVELAGAAIPLIEGKATFATGAGFAPQSLRDGHVVPKISRPPQLIDYLQIEPTDQNAVKFMKQSTRTNTAAPKAEGSAFDEATLVYSEATSTIRKIGVFLPVTEEQLDDEPSVRAIIENDLRLMVRQKLDEQITVGDGSGQNLQGLTYLSGALEHEVGEDEPFDALLKALTAVRGDGGARPNLIVLSSADYQTLAMTKTTDGQYLLGHPAESPMGRLWGVQIVTSDALTPGTGLVLDTDFIRVKMRKDLTVASSDSHSDFFAANKLALRAYVRAGLQVLRDEAVCIVAGL